MINLEIDGQQVQVDNGATVMEAASKLGIFVPHFCYHKKLSIAANCRMCLVQVEKAPKPLPACATPATEGMKVQTASQYAKTAQQGVMEFLLINHPLDCPICDQGGECQLQDLAVGYGGSASRYQEEKRVVVNKNLGPLISTDMTRCIHCTRCVRFGQEIAGVMELGMAGRGEHSEILSFVGKTVDSELSGNVIDLCPVGALTSKPFRYTARTWELSRRKSISPHDSLGANLVVQVKQNRVMRVLPLENEAVNECWLADRDRYSYEALNSEQRLTTPLVRKNGTLVAVDWQEALQRVADGLKQAQDRHGAEHITALASPHQTLEEIGLLKQLINGLGSNHLATRLRHADTSGHTPAQNTSARWLGMKISDIATLQSVLIIGSTLRKDHPLLANRFRQAAKKGLRINLLHAVDDDLLMPVANKAIVRPSALPHTLGQIAKTLAEIKATPLSTDIAALTANLAATAETRAIAQSLADKETTAVFLGNFAEHHPHAATLHALGQEIARLSGGTLGYFGEAANSVGAAVLGAGQAISQPSPKACLLLGVEPEHDSHNPVATRAALQAADFVVSMNAFQSQASEYAHVILPIAPFTETAGTFINTEGRVQSFNGVVKPQGDARPAWKVLRVIGNLLGLAGFEQDNIEAVRATLQGDAQSLQALADSRLGNTTAHHPALTLGQIETGIERIAEIPIYAADALVRRAPSLQKTADAKTAHSASLARDLAEQLGIRDGDMIRLTAGNASVDLPARTDANLPAGCVRVAAALAVTAPLGPMSGPLTLAKITVAVAAE